MTSSGGDLVTTNENNIDVESIGDRTEGLRDEPTPTCCTNSHLHGLHRAIN